MSDTINTADHPWIKRWEYDWDARALTAIPYKGQWTIVDRDTGDLIGSFGLLSLHDTEAEALEEAERFGSKWGWPTIPGGLTSEESCV